MRDVPKLLRGGEGLLERTAKRCSGALVPRGLGGRERDAEVVGEREQPLLRAVVQIALHPQPLVLASQTGNFRDQVRRRRGRRWRYGTPRRPRRLR